MIKQYNLKTIIFGWLESPKSSKTCQSERKEPLWGSKELITRVVVGYCFFLQRIIISADFWLVIVVITLYHSSLSIKKWALFTKTEKCNAPKQKDTQFPLKLTKKSGSPTLGRHSRTRASRNVAKSPQTWIGNVLFILHHPAPRPTFRPLRLAALHTGYWQGFIYK